MAEKIAISFIKADTINANKVGQEVLKCFQNLESEVETNDRQLRYFETTLCFTDTTTNEEQSLNVDVRKSEDGAVNMFYFF